LVKGHTIIILRSTFHQETIPFLLLRCLVWLQLSLCVFVSVPSPNVTVNPLSNQIVGQSLTLECNVTAVRGITSRVDIIWRRDDGAEELNRTNNTSPTMMPGSLVYTSTYTISQLSTTDDGREYQCVVVINTSPDGVMANGSIMLDVTGKFYGM